MANFSAADIKRLRDLSGAGMMDCKNALAESDGDIEAAIEALRKKGIKDAGKRADRTAGNNDSQMAQSGDTNSSSWLRPPRAPPMRTAAPSSAVRLISGTGSPALSGWRSASAPAGAIR